MYGSVANLAKPSSYKNICKGSQLTNKTYILRSNFNPSIK